MECMQVPKRKRGRPPKVRDENVFALDFPTSHLVELNARQIQFGYKILQDILKLSKTKHLIEKPDENLFGLHDYYTVIQNPLWFNQVLRKFGAEEYTGIHDVVTDLRLVLENCYRFWGPKHRFSKQAFRIEKLLEKELQAIPEDIRELCLINEGDKESNTNSDNDSSFFVDGTMALFTVIIKDIRELCLINEGDKESNTNSDNDSSFFVDDFNSKILKFLEKKERDEIAMMKESDTARKEELLKWESEVLMMKQYKKQISFMPELAEIGHFLALSHDILCLKRINQYEVERMLLMPKESTALATIMTALLSPSAMRGSLYFKPIMVYEVWSKFLSRKVDTWYKNFVKTNNKIQMFIKYGIETTFWEEVGETNPLLDCDFSTVAFTKRVWILKTLCTTIFHSYKKLEEYFNSVDESCLRGPVVYEDGKFDYISLFTPEVRVYRICRSEMEVDSSGEAVVITPVKNGFPPDIQIQDQGSCTILKNLAKKNNFYLAAHDMESLSTLIKVFSRRKKTLSRLKALLTTCELSERKTIEALTSMKMQWDKYKERSAFIVNNSLKYWIEKEVSPPMSPGDVSIGNPLRTEPESGESRASSESSILGKRPLKRKFSLDEWENSSDSSIEFKVEEDTSDWEEGNIRQKGSRRKYQNSRWRDSIAQDYQIRPTANKSLVAKTIVPATQPSSPSPSLPPSPQQSNLLPSSSDPLQPIPLSSSAPSHILSPTPPSFPTPFSPPTDTFTQSSMLLPSDGSYLNPLPSLTNLLPPLSPPQALPPMPGFLPNSMYQQLPPVTPLSSRSTYRHSYPRASYGRGRGRGMRMRFYQGYQAQPIRKFVRRPSIVATEITDFEANQQLKETDHLAISLNGREEVPLTTLQKLTTIDSDLFLHDLQAIKLEPLPWIQNLDQFRP